MIKGLKKFLFVTLFFIFSFNTFSNNEYTIQNYNLIINIDVNNRYSISEDLDAFFSIKKHGIVRKIPTKYGDRNLNLSNLNILGPYAVKELNSGINIYLGDANKYVFGNKHYNLSYTYDMKWDGNDNYDEIYYNLIGNDWDTTIENFNFSITLPKKFDPSKIKFTTGNYGDRFQGNVSYEILGNTIKGFITKPLMPGEALTIALPLPNNYFETSSQKNILKLLKFSIYSFSLFLPLLAGALWNKYGKNSPLIETIEFYPPNNMNPTEIGYYIDGTINLIDITSLIIYWADKGYLEISEKGEDSLFEKKDYILEKKKNILEINSYEPYLFKNIFNFASYENKVSVNSLRNKFFKYIEKTTTLFRIDLAMNGKKLYSKKSLEIGNSILFFPIFLILLALLEYSYFYQISIFSFEIINGILSIPFNFPIIIFSSLVLIVIGKNCKKRTAEYQDILGRVKGFKKFLETAEKEKLEMLIDENPSYFYNILPYTIVLKVSEKWSEKFNSLVTKPPNWYHSNQSNMFTTLFFLNSLNHSLRNMRQNFYSQPASVNRGPGISSMGGGSAGGGAGGGGGSSW